jgi:uncharacterized protein (TIGR02246 family)
VRKLLCVSAVLGLVLLAGPAMRAEEKADPKVAEALKARAEEFTKAFDKGDAKALAAFWTEDGDYVDQAGHTLKGRKAIEAAFEKQFEAETATTGAPFITARVTATAASTAPATATAATTPSPRPTARAATTAATESALLTATAGDARPAFQREGEHP